MLYSRGWSLPSEAELPPKGRGSEAEAISSALVTEATKAMAAAVVVVVVVKVRVAPSVRLARCLTQGSNDKGTMGLLQPGLTPDKTKAGINSNHRNKLLHQF